MKKLLALILAMLILTGCGASGGQESELRSDYGLWFAVRRDSGRSESCSVEREERMWNAEPTARQLMDALLAGPEGDGLYSPFPYGVTVRGIVYDQPNATLQVDMSEQYGGLVGYDLTLADSCIALTLCQLPGVDAVEVLVAGEPVPYRNRQQLQQGDLLLAGVGDQPESVLVTLYFPGTSGETLIVERRSVESAGESAAQIALTELFRGPTECGACVALPAGTKLRSLSVSDGLCQVDLSREFLPGSGRNSTVNLYALVNTLCDLGEIDQVRLLIEGERLENYGSISLKNPLTANYDLLY